MKGSPILAGVDTGGTFTDFIFVRAGKVTVDKRPSHPTDPVSVIRRGVAGFLGTLADGSEDELLERFGKDIVLVHGTTVSTNALLEGKTAKTCLVTNRGFEDVIEIGRQERLHLFRLPVRKAKAPVPRRLRFGVDQRTLHSGREETRLKEADIRAVVEKALRSGARTAAVCLLYSFLRPEPERRLGRALAKAGFSVSHSSRVAPEFREYERASTTVINASLKPVMEGYLKRLEEAFPGAEILVMCSSGGVAPPSEAAERPVVTILSGPAGGVAGTAALLRSKSALLRSREPSRSDMKAITFDMGGTSTDVSLIDGEPLRRHQSSITGLPLLVPSVDIHTVGAGGGSKIWIDRGGALRVGPESAGADPGPACYGRASTPALTDAHLALGRLDPSGLLGGGFPVKPRRSAKALVPLARRLGVTQAALCRGVLDVADAVVEKAVRVITLGRGRDPGDFPLVAFGGAGPLHACRLMKSMGLPAAIIPPDPGVLSASGIASAELREERSAGFPLALGGGAEEKMKKVFRRIEEEWRRERRVRGRVNVFCEADLRYRGQSFELILPFEKGRRLAERFHEAHLEQYGHCNRDGRVESVALRTRFIRDRDFSLPLFGGGNKAGNSRKRIRKQRPKTDKEIKPQAGFGTKPLPLFERQSLRPGDTIAGPAVVTEFSATTVVEKGCLLVTDRFLNLVIK